MERMFCPRVHFKCVIADGREAYFGAANLTGAGMGANSDRKRNFENGVWTDDPALVGPLAEQFDAVWRGDFCRDCGRRKFCGDCPV
jgi:phosphatidylserine/phosphatidylglycerophosphate/cardiolipin synthase-like enzyme